MPLTGEISSSGRPRGYIRIIPTPHMFDCKGACGRKGLTSTAPTAKYCQRSECQRARRAASRERCERKKLRATS